MGQGAPGGPRLPALTKDEPMRRRAAAVALCLAAAGPAAAHPHVFVDARVAFLLDATGLLEAVRVSWVLDPLFSMLLLGEMGLDPLSVPDAGGRAALSALQPGWAAEYGGAGTLSIQGIGVALAPARDAEAGIVDGSIEIAFTRPLETPLDPRGGTVGLSVYDPRYFVAYRVTEVSVAGGGCTARALPFEPDRAAAALMADLATLGREETPADPTVGARLADRAVLTCG